MTPTTFKIIFMLVFYLSLLKLAIKSFYLRVSTQLSVNIYIIMAYLDATQFTLLCLGWREQGEEVVHFFWNEKGFWKESLISDFRCLSIKEILIKFNLVNSALIKAMNPKLKIMK